MSMFLDKSEQKKFGNRKTMISLNESNVFTTEWIFPFPFWFEQIFIRDENSTCYTSPNVKQNTPTAANPQRTNRVNESKIT